MPTQAQLNANRLNSQKSTGPTAPAGQATSSFPARDTGSRTTIPGPNQRLTSQNGFGPQSRPAPAEPPHVSHENHEPPLRLASAAPGRTGILACPFLPILNIAASRQ